MPDAGKPAASKGPLLVVMNMQEGVITPPGFKDPPEHLKAKTHALYDFVAAAREAGCRVAWLFQGEDLPERECHVSRDFQAAKKYMQKPEHAPLADLPVQDGDAFVVRRVMDHQFDISPDIHGEQIGLSKNRPIAVAGFYHEEPCHDGTYLFAHELALNGIHSSILEDLTDNIHAVARDPHAQKNIKFLQDLKDGIVWVKGKDWLDVVQEERPNVAAPIRPRTCDA